MVCWKKNNRIISFVHLYQKKTKEDKKQNKTNTKTKTNTRKKKRMR